MDKVIDYVPEIKQVIYSNPVTVVIWADGSKTISRCDDNDIYDELTGFMLCVFKKALTPKAMRKMFNQYVYDVDSDKIKWQSEPTWLEEYDIDAILDECSNGWGFEVNMNADELDDFIGAFLGNIDRYR